MRYGHCKHFINLISKAHNPFQSTFVTLKAWQVKLGNMCSQCKHKLTVCPWNVLIGLSTMSLHTWIHWSVEQEAKLVLLCQSTSKAGAVHRHTQRNLQGNPTNHSHVVTQCSACHAVADFALARSTQQKQCLRYVNQETGVGLILTTLMYHPVHQRGDVLKWKLTWMKGKLLCAVSWAGIPNNCSLEQVTIHSSCESTSRILHKSI